MIRAPLSSAARADGDARPTQLLALLALVAAWVCYLPLGLQYGAYLGSGLLATWILMRTQRLQVLIRHPVFLAGLGLWSWLALSAAWTRAPTDAVIAHLWTYSLMLWVAPIAIALPADAARGALRHFVAASCIVATAIALDAAGWLPAWHGWRPFVDISGNQRIVFSVLLALALAMAVLQVLEMPRLSTRLPAVAAAGLCLAALMLQDRRTGMLAAPVLLAALAVARQRTAARRLGLLLLVLAAAVAVWAGSDHVRQRFDEGVAELRAYHSDGEVSTSWGMRARMLEVTGRLVLERPLVGHGIGSWVTEWRQRVAGSAALEAHTTPHNEYLLLAMQGGAVGLALALVLWLTVAAGIVRRGPAAHAALLVWTALTWAALFNVALRDAKFALPLLTLAALSWAGSGGDAGSAPTPHAERQSPAA
jgi:O-antigen ligase